MMGRSMEHLVCGKCGANAMNWGSFGPGPFSCAKCGTLMLLESCPVSPDVDDCCCVKGVMRLYRRDRAQYDAWAQEE